MPLPRLTPTYSPTASGLYLVHCVLSGTPLADQSTAQVVAPVAERLQATLTGKDVSPAAFLEQAIPLAASPSTERGLAQAALSRLIARSEAEVLTPSVADALHEMRRTLEPLPACSVERLELRYQPLEQQWNARGMGLLRSISRHTGPEWIAEQGTILPVHPLSGGGGLPHPSYNVITIEAVLTNSRDDVPEVARLAWLAAQLQLELPVIQEPFHRERIRYLAALALVPAALAAAQEMELCYPQPDTLAAAIESWIFRTPLHLLLDSPANRADAVRDVEPLAQQLDNWWNVLADSQLSWQVGLRGLDQMLQDGQH